MPAHGKQPGSVMQRLANLDMGSAAGSVARELTIFTALDATFWLYLSFVCQPMPSSPAPLCSPLQRRPVRKVVRLRQKNRPCHGPAPQPVLPRDTPSWVWLDEGVQQVMRDHPYASMPRPKRFVSVCRKENVYRCVCCLEYSQSHIVLHTVCTRLGLALQGMGCIVCACQQHVRKYYSCSKIHTLQVCICACVYTCIFSTWSYPDSLT